MKLPLIIELLFWLTIVRVLIVILHELGHAIPAAILTQKRVSVYIGSYGNKEKSLPLRIGLLDIWFYYGFTSWKGGLCVPSVKNVPVKQQMIYILCGPVSPFIVSAIGLFLVYSFDLNERLRLIVLLFSALSALGLFTNLIPKKKPITLFNGKTTYNDGQTLWRLYKLRKISEDYMEAVDLFNNRKYSESIAFFDAFLESGIKDETICRLNATANIQIKNYERAKILFDLLKKEFELTSDDYCNKGFLYSKLGMDAEALEFYDASLRLNPKNLYTLNNKGFALNLLERYTEAIPLFDKAIEIDAQFAYSYNNRGLAKIKTGETDEGLADIEKSIELDKENSYSYRNLGIYHFDQGRKDKARELFLKSKELDSETHSIDELILSTANG